MPLVLLIEDSPTQAEEIASQISRYGVDVMVANDGLQGLRLVDSNRPDLILLDVNLPKMDGYQVCHRLKRDPDTKGIPVVMLTVASGSDDTLKGLEAGADDYIPKDAFAVENLTGTLRSLGLIS